MNQAPEDRQFRQFFGRRWDRLGKALAVLVLGVGLVVLLVSIGGEDAFAQIDPDNPGRAYLCVFFFVAADAVVPIFPGETTLNAASALAASGDLELWAVIVLGALGAIVGDSSLYWIAPQELGADHSATRPCSKKQAC